MAGFNDILNPAPAPSTSRTSHAGSSGGGGGPAGAVDPASSPAHSLDDAHSAGSQHQHQSQSLQRPASSSSSSRRSASGVVPQADGMSLDIGSANASHPHGHARPSYISIASPNAGASRASISTLLGDSVESPRSRPTASGASSPADDNRRSFHPPWPHNSGSGPASAPPTSEGGSAPAGHGMRFLLNHGTPGAVIERKNSRSASSSSQGPGPGPVLSPLPPPPQLPAASSSSVTMEPTLGRTASAPAGPIASPSGSISEASTTGGGGGGGGGASTSGSAGGNKILNRVWGFFRGNKEGAVSPSQQSAGPPPAQHSSSYAAPPAGPPGHARPPYDHSPSGGSQIPLPLTPGTPHTPAEHPHMHYPVQHPPLPPQQPPPYYAHGGPPPGPGYSTGGSSVEYGRRPLPPGYPDGVEYSPTLAVSNGHPAQYQHQYYPHAQHPQQPPYPPAHQQLQQQQPHSNRASLSPTIAIQALPPQAPYPPFHEHLHPGPRHFSQGHPPPMAASGSGPGTDMSPPPVPASTSRSAGAGPLPGGGAKMTASSSSLSAAGETETGTGGTAPTKKRPRSGRGESGTTPASSRPPSPADALATATTSTAAATVAATSSEAATPTTTPSVLMPIPAELRDPKVNVKRLPPPKFAKASPGAGGVGGGGAAPLPGSTVAGGSSAGPGGTGSSESPAPRTPGAPKDWMSGGIMSAAVGLATGLDGGAGAAAVSAAATAALKLKEQEEKEKAAEKAEKAAAAAAAAEGGTGDSKGSGAASRRKSSSASASASAKRSASDAGLASIREAAENAVKSAIKKGRRSTDAGEVSTVVEEGEDGGVSGGLAPTARAKREGSGAGRSGAGAFGAPDVPSIDSAGPTSSEGMTGSSRQSLDQHPNERKVLNPIPYDPRRRTAPTTINKPIRPDEIEAFKKRHRNPLRWKYEEEVLGLVKSDARDGDHAEPQQGYAAGKRKREDQDSSSRGSAGPARASLDQPAAKRSAVDADSTVVAKGPDNNEVSEHYNSRKDVGVVARRESKIYPLKKFNNWAKNVLIQRYSRSRCRVLDLGCGKGGDLNKWARARADSIVMIDIAGMSVGQAETRYREQRHRFEAEFFTFDCFSRPLSSGVPQATLKDPFDVVTLQFCMHYGWETVEKARTLLENVATYLKPGGYFIGTIPDADNLISRLDELKGDTLEFGNTYYRVTFEQKEKRPPFGHKYWFFLEDAVEDVPEYVVDWDKFVDLARDVGLKPVYRRTFAQMYHDAANADAKASLALRHARDDLQSMGVRLPRHDGDIPMDKELWEAVCLYLGFAFERV